MDDFAYYKCGNCKSHDVWTGECCDKRSLKCGDFTRDSDDACGEWEEADD